MLRTDLRAMHEFDKARSSDSTPDGVKLFWNMWQPPAGQASLQTTL